MRTILLALLMACTMQVGAVQAAIFDCAKAATETEKAICADPELSKLDEKIAKVYSSLDQGGRYFSEVVKAHQIWLKSDRLQNHFAFELQLPFLEFSAAFSSCYRDKISTTCDEKIGEIFENCNSPENYTTYVMGKCLGAYVDALQLIEKFETSQWRLHYKDEKETRDQFDAAHTLWSKFVDADCGWQYTEAGSGSKRVLNLLSCQRAHLEARIAVLQGYNDLYE
jgi:uncharacterized protein YecT (DUF1311 family)